MASNKNRSIFMKKVSVLGLIFIFFSSFYMLPSLEAITLGDLKPGAGEETPERNKVNSRPEEVKKKSIPSAKLDQKLPEGRDRGVNPRLVCLLSVVMPGGGQFYLNNDTKGLAFCLTAGLGYTATGYFLIKTMLSDSGTTEYKNYLLLTGFLFFISIIIHLVGIIEAYSDAEDMNRRNLFGSGRTDNPFIADIIIK